MTCGRVPPVSYVKPTLSACNPREAVPQRCASNCGLAHGICASTTARAFAGAALAADPQTIELKDGGKIGIESREFLIVAVLTEADTDWG